MKVYAEGTKNYEIANKWIGLDAAAIVEKLGKIENAGIQMGMIDTMYRVISSDRSYLRSSASVTSVQIRNQQRSKIEHWGEKAFGLSEAQLGVIARDLVSLAATQMEEAE